MTVKMSIEYDDETGGMKIETNVKGPLFIGLLEYVRESYRVRTMLPELVPKIQVAQPREVC